MEFGSRYEDLCKLAEDFTDTICTLLENDTRTSAMQLTTKMGPSSEVFYDFSRQCIDLTIFQKLKELTKEADLPQKIAGMYSGERVNQTERRQVLHVALRARKDGPLSKVLSSQVVNDVNEVLDRIEAFSTKVRKGDFKGHSGKTLTDVVCIGIGGSYLGPEFVYEAMRTEPECMKNAKGRRLRFLANIDPVDCERALDSLCPETTLVIVISKTFTTLETMVNAKIVKQWILNHYKGDESAVAQHMAAVSTNLEATAEFGINSDNVFGFWDWVGGRFSVCSAVGALPLAIHFGFSKFREFLDGCAAGDLHFYENRNSPEKNIPILMALVSIWNSSFRKKEAIAVLPYSQALCRFPAHIQQLTMESNGKTAVLFEDQQADPSATGEIYFGEPGTNGQHSFYQMIHQGREIPCEFIGFCRSQSDKCAAGDKLSAHDHLMCNFFAQPDALATGVSRGQLQQVGTPGNLLLSKEFPGARPSTLLLFEECSPFNVGVLLSLYEHRVASQGFIWGINSFDQYGVELGKVLAKGTSEVLRSSELDKSQLTSKGLTTASLAGLQFYQRHGHPACN